MIPLLIVFAGLLGLAVGSFVNVVVFRVPNQVSLLRESRCPNCGAPIRARHNVPVASWLLLRGRCAACTRAISPRYPIVEAANGIAFAALAWFVPEVLGSSGVPGVLIWTAFAWFAAATSALILIDLDTHLLPDAIVLPSFGVGLALLGLACGFGVDWTALLRAAIGAAAMYVAYWLIRCIRPDGMGGGDVKVAGLSGLYLGWLGWGPLAVGWLAAFVLGGAFSLGLIATKRAERSTAIPFGPWVLTGAWVGICFGDLLWHYYLALSGLI